MHHLETILRGMCVVLLAVLLSVITGTASAYPDHLRRLNEKEILARINEEPVVFHIPKGVPLEDVLKHIRFYTRGPNDSGLPILIDPIQLKRDGQSPRTPADIDIEGVRLKSSLSQILGVFGLDYIVKDGALKVIPVKSDGQRSEGYQEILLMTFQEDRDMSERWKGLREK